LSAEYQAKEQVAAAQNTYPSRQRSAVINNRTQAVKESFQGKDIFFINTDLNPGQPARIGASPVEKIIPQKGEVRGVKHLERNYTASMI